MARAAKQRLPRVPFNASWKTLYHLWQIGEPDGAEKHLYLTSSDYILLREMAQIDSGLDILSLDFDMPRQQMSHHSANEKYANISPEADYVLIKLSSRIAQALVADPAVDLMMMHNCSLRLKVDSALALCQRLNIANLIVVENLDSFDNLFGYSFAPDLQTIIDNSMVLYRGSHHYSPAGRKRFLHLINPTKIQVIAFTDLDPAGLMIANTLDHCERLIVPQLALRAPATLLALPQINSTADFHKQHRQLAYLTKILAANNNVAPMTHTHQPPLSHQQTLGSLTSDDTANAIGSSADWDQLVAWVVRYHVSIKQQHMQAKKLVLSLLRF
ncbi:MAG: hypothetical protein V7771_10225 [Shewanella psychromarinicola]|uniref:DUF7281 domain-containing protein n=1 Tax=Shewanella psychromarinicola TaxID=2487742 RepID=UPI003003345F